MANKNRKRILQRDKDFSLTGDCPLAKRYTENLAAYDLCLKARYHLLKLTQEGREAGLRYKSVGAAKSSFTGALTWLKKQYQCWSAGREYQVGGFLLHDVLGGSRWEFSFSNGLGSEGRDAVRSLGKTGRPSRK
jgi:hypothetical protein